MYEVLIFFIDNNFEWINSIFNMLKKQKYKEMFKEIFIYRLLVIYLKHKGK